MRWAYSFVMIEASLPRRRDGHNLWPVAAVEALGELELMVEEARDHAEVAGKLGDARLKRLDVTHDLTCNELPVQSVLRALWNRRVGSGRVSQAHGYRANDVIETMKFGTAGGWRVTAYDKHVQCGLPEAEGLLRVEARITRDVLVRSAWARRVRGVMRVCDDLDQAKVERLGVAMARRVRLADGLVTDDGAHPIHLDYEAGIVRLLRSAATDAVR